MKLTRKEGASTAVAIGFIVAFYMDRPRKWMYAGIAMLLYIAIYMRESQWMEQPLFPEKTET